MICMPWKNCWGISIKCVIKMKHQIVIILSIITFILGCVDFEQKTKQAVDDGVMQASSMLTDSIAFHKKE